MSIAFHLLWMGSQKGILSRALFSGGRIGQYLQCIVFFLIWSAERLALLLRCLWIHSKEIKPVPKIDIPDFTGVLDKVPFAVYPMLLVQFPCVMRWRYPRDNFKRIWKSDEMGPVSRYGSRFESRILRMC